ncbi:MAG: ankyrin repeat domain-containing protein [Candidatus Thiodiazotropha sp. (ex Codakia orbicularis)]|nr:ankyrin repeat domain-containing protein [Candidatus Thiodiazotropha sp. (ex Codakia orbicularis)]
MGLPAKKLSYYKDRGEMEYPPNILEGALFNDIEEIEAAISENPACIEEVTQEGMNALQLALSHGCFDAAKYLAEVGVDPLHRDSFGRTAVIIASELGFERGAKIAWEAEMRAAPMHIDEQGNIVQDVPKTPGPL